MAVEQGDGVVTVARPTDRGEHRALHGLTRSLIANMVEGVTEGFEKRLEIQGVGYRAALKGKNLELALGYSHPVSSRPPRDRVRGPAADRGDRARHRQAARRPGRRRIRKRRTPEPYKGKGIRYKGEQVLRKVGKRA